MPAGDPHGSHPATAEGGEASVSAERVVAALGAADRRLGGGRRGASELAERLHRELDAGRIVLSPTIMADAGRAPSRPLASCAAPPVNLRSQLRTIQAVVDSYHAAGMGTGFNLDGLEDPLAMLQYLNYVAAAGPGPPWLRSIALLSLSHPRAEQLAASTLAADTEGEVWRVHIALRVSDAEIRAALRRDGPERAALLAAAGAARSCGEPALVFGDRLEETNPTPLLGPYTATAPDAEVGLLTGETCVFGQVDLSRFRRRAKPGRSPADDRLPLDLDGLADAVWTLVRALDAAVEIGLPWQPTVLSRELTRANRKIGVGVCGLGALLEAAGVAYDSLRGHVIAQEALAYVNYVAKVASADLAVQRGPCPAVAWGRSRYADPGYLRRFGRVDVRSVTSRDWDVLADRVAETHLLRNTTTTAIAPAGPVAAAGPAGVPSGIDPAGEVPPTAHLTMAAAAQACVDESVAATIRLPAGAAPEDVYGIYVAAWELRCKSVTVAACP
jgi:ribonucleoside-diphosphate reductase alpha chain